MDLIIADVTDLARERGAAGRIRAAVRRRGRPRRIRRTLGHDRLHGADRPGRALRAARRRRVNEDPSSPTRSSFETRRWRGAPTMRDGFASALSWPLRKRRVEDGRRCEIVPRRAAGNPRRHGVDEREEALAAPLRGRRDESTGPFPARRDRSADSIPRRRLPRPAARRFRALRGDRRADSARRAALLERRPQEAYSSPRPRWRGSNGATDAARAGLTRPARRK